MLGLVRNEEGDVEVTFSEPVHVQGEVELYVLDPETGGWGLPLLDGSGTDTLTFDADAEDRPTLIVGESQLAGFAFPSARLADNRFRWHLGDPELRSMDVRHRDHTRRSDHDRRPAHEECRGVRVRHWKTGRHPDLGDRFRAAHTQPCHRETTPRTQAS